MPTTADITILGTIVFDIFIPNVKNYPRSGQAIEIESFPIFTGGCGANTSIILARLGINVSLIGAVGNDLFGKYVINYLNECKVNIDLVRISKNKNTSTSILLINDKNERSYFHSVGANSEIQVSNKDLKVITKSKIFHIGGVNLLPSLDGKPMSEILKKAKSKNVVTSIDLAWDTKNRWMKNLYPSIPFIDILMCNQDELKALTGEKKLNRAIKLLHQLGVKIVVVKLAEKGSLVSKNFLIERVPPFEVKAKDSTGAGDAFAGGFLYGLISGKSLYESALIGNYFGAIVTQDYGSTSALQKLNSLNLNKIIS